jgi:general secretion pathway protein C
MASSPKRWLWVVNVVAIVLGAWLCAGTVDAMVAATFSPSGSTASAPKRPNALFASNQPNVKGVEWFLNPIKQRNIFNHGEPVPDEEVPVDPALANLPPDACTVPIQVLSAVIVAKNPSLSLATVQDSSISPAGIVVYQVGERVANQATLVNVMDETDDLTLKEVSSVELLRDDGRREICRSDASGPGKGPAVAALMPAVPGGPAAPTGEGIKKVTDDKFEVSQSTLDGVMNGGLGQLAQDVRIVPYYEGGVSKGFKMYSIKPGSLLAQIGLMNGDVIEKINGYDISSPEKALQIYGLLKNEKNVSVDLNRNGQNKTISYAIH